MTTGSDVITIESAREAAAPLLRGERDGWVDLPCGGSVLIEKRKPTALSTSRRPLGRPDTEPVPWIRLATTARIRWEAERALDLILVVGPWTAAESEDTAPILWTETP
jgi:hypothetical protein